MTSKEEGCGREGPLGLLVGPLHTGLHRAITPGKAPWARLRACGMWHFHVPKHRRWAAGETELSPAHRHLFKQFQKLKHLT